MPSKTESDSSAAAGTRAKYPNSWARAASKKPAALAGSWTLKTHRCAYWLRSKRAAFWARIQPYKQVLHWKLLLQYFFLGGGGKESSIFIQLAEKDIAFEMFKMMDICLLTFYFLIYFLLLNRCIGQLNSYNRSLSNMVSMMLHIWVSCLSLYSHLCSLLGSLPSVKSLVKVSLFSWDLFKSGRTSSQGSWINI